MREIDGITILRPLDGLHIEGRRWFRKSAGNTYSSATIYANGDCIAHVGPTGGYGDYYLQMAVEWLQQNGYLGPKTEYGGTRFIREDLHGTYSVTDVAREKDL